MSVAVAEQVSWADGVAGVHTALDALVSHREVDDHLTDADLRTLSASLARAKARIDAALMVLARGLHERDTARAVGATNTGQLLAADFGGDRREGNALVRAAIHLSNTPVVEDALAEGRVNREQAGTIAKALTHLPVAVAPEDRVRAQESLLDAARLLSIQDLGRAATRAADAFKTPAEADEHEENQLQARERRAARAARFWMRDNRDGTHRGGFTVPDTEAEMLRTAIEALSAPRRYHLEDTEPAEAAESGEPGESRDAGLPSDQAHRQGRAFATICTHLPADALPNAGGIAAVLTVNVDYDTLTGQVGPGTLPSGTRISASKAREIGCGAGILPQVLGGKSLPLDLGQLQRFFNATQRRALALRDRGCAYPGCDRPPHWCEGHHWRNPWTPHNPEDPHGGTDLDNGCLLCAHHHRLVHDRNFQIRERHDHLEFLVPPVIGQKTSADYGGDLFTPDNPPGTLRWQRNYHWSAHNPPACKGA
ncbi:uncharacterized protein DUF222 [Branchiibius hedensis]|uniref:DUF222 domain-containing protein n=1 Tax=Branchiibius hedensis TaxID=672460 RepID=A0A2Y8ZMX6_9MICO|nr:HNH endonuclease signature motif containing protein [Branchiibius hedensis]PWJ23968.1 uncharacterized protein DUF222 [Branchiibius hedensis]SSA32786.1 protein of unknown function [Branchiibius hedensis]